MAKSYVCGGLTANELYDLFNARYFRNRLPKIPVRWVVPISGRRNKSVIGSTSFEWRNGAERPFEIRLHPRLKTEGTIWALTLIHEMVHVDLWDVPAKQAHGRKFNRRMKQLAARGAFNGLW